MLRLFSLVFIAMSTCVVSFGECKWGDSFEGGLNNWVIEQAGDGDIISGDGCLEIKDKEGCTVWFRYRLNAPVVITYDAEVIDAGGDYDRLSDLNCFWMASDPRHPNDLFFENHGRTGDFKTYNILQTYYVGYGGNDNTTTRFRRYSGNGEKPLLPEHDLGSDEYLLMSEKVYHIRLEAIDGKVRYIRDGDVIFDFYDPDFLKSGWFGIRTFNSHLKIRNFRILAHDRN
ncbi:hypothetical protein H5P28_00975 [Ruficoccus amylovorans]|uniref:DUF6250 domain-containing protein n=1 Tax=Ruficoccus amylovorans TaxID=1804625 RepID=A0A842HB71_9BACT|nr:DUF6250 domain-containing protein [Ruficoccus amylovorans]MBC2592824.1 hypothetical protein [Ruficoccus amylovorans]